ncbi:ABC-type cobalamin/Fe3+-siderophore transport system, ATPase component [Spongiibacter sp. IMCC21906]|jgi:iron complex transport system ATP-binding protein|uniref:ABC transporter ATP-binding protein n=1 Tax=Spongiibacter sp. IMCC21906 TaxID=1620392 RepID=UPI00062DDCAC|nr:ABC transporter ATP-binding protein [Spongiibacter sp. IMCC21906]AKH68927.1 ABC-type cobalamin/Fe3+-siderophore transport system, ATPase component [Spongiibacter sp. IMCC21906]
MSVLSTEQLVVDIPGKADGTPLNITIRPGEVWGVLGPNGAGKTTLLHTLAGLRAPRHGRVLLEGKALSHWRRKALAQKLAVIFQERQDGFPGTVLETAMIGRHPFLSHWELDTADDVAIAKKALAAMELEHMSHRLVNTLSGGERQRLTIATALIQTPQILLADEPSNHLDLKHQVHIMQLIREQAHSGCGVLLCLHDLNIAARCCDKLLLLYPNGEACWGDADTMLVPGALEKLYDQPLMAIEANGQRFFLPREQHD